MKNIKIGIGQIQVLPAEIQRNAANILDEIKNAEKKDLDILVFPEFSLSGYLIGDMWERPAFLKECEYWQEKIISSSKKCLIVFGNVVTDWNVNGEDGRPRRFNCAIAAQNQTAIINPGINRPYFIKTLLPNYREFDESRHFYDMRKLSLETGCSLEELLQTVEVNLRSGKIKIGITLCEDAWSEDYANSPFSMLKQKKADILLNLSCSPFTLGKNEKRHRMFSAQAKKLSVPIIFVNSVGIQNNGKTLFTFDGSSAIYNNKGEVIFESEAYVHSVSSYKLSLPGKKVPKIKSETNFGRKHLSQRKKDSDIYRALVYGTQSFLAQLSIKRVVIGISGGIDSAVSAALYGSFLPKKDLLLVSMPSRFNSKTTRRTARQLAKNLGCYFLETGIDQSMELTKAQLDDVTITSIEEHMSERLRLDSFAMENVQARDRSSRLLAAISSAFGGVFSCNSNKAEMVVGYSTLYGDLCGYLGMIGDLWKNDVYRLGRYLNRHIFKRVVIPSACFSLVPSAELNSNQNVDQGKGDPLCYPYHDKLFFTWIQSWMRTTPEEILQWFLEGTLADRLGCNGDLIKSLFPTNRAFISDLEKWWELYNGLGVVKRVQAPPVLAVSSRAFGFDHREHIGRPFYSRNYLQLKRKSLK